MTLIDRYIMARLVKGWLLLLAILSAVVGILAGIEELERVHDRYSALDAFHFIALSMPHRALDLAPVVTLLGTLIAVLSLARHNELIAIRAAGISPGRVLRAALLPIFLLIVFLALSAEYISAPLYQKAELMRGAMRSGSTDLLNGKGLWSSKDLRFINIRELHPDDILLDVDLYEFDDSGTLILAIHAARAEIDSDEKWLLSDVSYKELIDGRLVDHYWEKHAINAWLSREELSLLSLSHVSMPLSVLYQYTQYLAALEQPAERIELLFWQKIINPFTAGAMVFLGIPVGAGSGTQRSGNLGLRIAAGALIGIIFYLATQIIYATGLLLELDAFIIVLIPVFIILAASALLLLRMR